MKRADPAAALNAPGPPVAVEAHRSIEEIPQADWDACFPGDPEGWAYYRAIEASRLPGFAWVYFAAWEAGRAICVVPGFITRYRLDTTIQGRLRTALAPLLKLFGGLLTLRLACLGSPHADRCHLGFAPGLPAARRAPLAASLLAGLDAFAAAEGIGLVAAKDMADADLGDGLAAAFAEAGFARQPSLPNATLALPPGGEEGYLASLSPGARREVRRKLKSQPLVHVDVRRGQQALELVPQIMQLYENQRCDSAVDFDQFEALTPDYFRAVLVDPESAAVVFAYVHDAQLVAFNLCLHTGRVFIDKFIGFSAPLSRTLNLYVLSWMNNVRYCLERSIPVLQTGQTAYAMKLRLGSELRPNWLYFRHRNRLLNCVLRLASPLLAADRYDPDLGKPEPGAA